MKLLSPIQENDDIVNKKYVDDKVAEVGAPILDVNSLPTITDNNKNQILKYDGKLYYARPVYENKHIEVGDDLSGATLINTWPNEGENIWDLYGSPWLDVSVTAQVYTSFISTDNNKGIGYWRGGPSNTQDYVSASGFDQVYLMTGGMVSTNEKSIQLSNDFGVVTSVSGITTTNPLYNQLFVRVITGYAWCEVSNDVAISTTEPTGNEKVWIDPEEDDIDVEEIVVDLNSTFPIGSEYITSNNVNPGTKIGGTWQLVKNYIGGELIAFGQLTNRDTGVTLVNGTYQAWSGTFLSNNVNTYIKNYYSGSLVLEYTSGAFKVHSRGIVGLVEAEIILSGNKNSACYAIWYSNNANDLPAGVSLIGDNKALMTVGTSGNTNYGGCRNSYMFEVTAGPNNDVEFYVNPWMVAYPSGAEFYPGNGGVKCSIKVKVYTTKETRFLWKRIA